MPQVSASGPSDREGTAGVASTIEQQLSTMRGMAESLYPDDADGRKDCHIGFLERRLREYAAKFIALEIRES